MLFARAPGQAFKVGLYLKRGCLLCRLGSGLCLTGGSQEGEGREEGRRREAKTEEGKRTTLRRKERGGDKTMTAVQTRSTSNESRVFVKWKERVSTPLRCNRPPHKERFLSRCLKDIRRLE